MRSRSASSIAAIDAWLNQHGYKKKKRQNNTLDAFAASFIKGVLDNPVYCGKLAYGRRKNEKVSGTRNEYRIVKQEKYMIHDGIHEGIISETDWELAHQKRQKTGVKYEKTHSLDHEHILSGILRCPSCGSGMYGNVNRKKKKDGTLYKDYFYYACKHRRLVDGHKCGYRKQWSEEDSTIRNFRIVQTEGSRQVTRDTKHYNLQMIIAVGFKVNSERAVQFRKWVNQIAKDYTIKGWVMDDERLKRGTYLTEKYFDEQLERIREIRASERKFYQKITDLYATAIDYDKNSATTRRFYATVQNKMHYAVHGHTAAELIVERADHIKEHMGLTTWADAPEGKIKKSDVTVAKNYLSQDEMKQLNRMVTAYLDFAENMTLRHIPLTMQDWEKRLNSFIEMFDYGILQDAGKVSAEIAKLHAETEFEKYRVIQDRLFMSDFDKFMLELEESAKK